MIHSRLVGHYTIRHLMKYIFYQKSDVVELLQNMPARKNYAFYSQGRHALFYILKGLIEQQNITTIGVPVWCCSIVHSVIDALPIKKVLLDVNPENLKIDIGYFDKVALQSNVDCVLLICENGNLYQQEEIDFFKTQNIITILDCSLAARNLEAIEGLDADFEIYSGGFSKPVSSFELGIAMSNKYPVRQVEMIQKFAFNTFFKVIIHMACQSQIIYSVLMRFLPRDDSSYYSESEEVRASYRSISVFLMALQHLNQHKNQFVLFQKKMHEYLISNSIISTLDSANGTLLSKVLVPKEFKVKNMEMHKQYVSQQACINSSENLCGAKNIVNNFHSFSISYSVVTDKKLTL